MRRLKGTIRGCVVGGALLIALLSITSITIGQYQRRPKLGIEGAKAPSFGVEQWINLPEGKRSLQLRNLHGKVVYLLCFQSWCPGCHSHGFPTLVELIDHFEGNDDVVFIGVQTVFEGFSTNTAERAWETARRYELEIPIGHDAGDSGRRSDLMRRYRTGGTPWTVIIDREGRVRFNGFRIQFEDARQMIDKLRQEPAPAETTTIETLPASRGGQDLIGTRFPNLKFNRWIKQPPLTLYRWWTDTCPYCARSLPAIEQWRRKYEKQGLVVVAVYHPKPPRSVDEADVLAAAKELGYRGPIAVDEDWSKLERAYLDSGDRGATSVTFLVDRDGIIRFVHPGPVFFASDDPRFAEANADHRLLEKAIEALLRDSIHHRGTEGTENNTEKK
ncbi:MAG: peroxiredoxin family protein [Planctomycetota bacterium]